MKNFNCPLLFSSVLIAAASLRVSAQETILTSVPMQGGMLHVELEYHADSNQLTVHVPEAVPRLSPLLESHPGHAFESAAPWFQTLDPSAQGMAFNRQFGFVMGGESDFLPPGAAVTFRLISSTDGLEFYAYRANDPQGWDPMFGTQGSSFDFQWGLTMYHPSIAAPPGSGMHEAVFEAFVHDQLTGDALEEIDPYEFTLTWHAPDSEPVPEIAIARKIVLTWPGTASDYTVEVSDTMEPGSWAEMSAHPMSMNGQTIVIIDSSHAGQFFRLKKAAAGEDGGAHVHNLP